MASSEHRADMAKSTRSDDVLIRTSLPGPRGRALLERKRSHPVLAGYTEPQLSSDVVFLAGQRDGFLWDVDGNRFIDFSAGWATNNLGHVPADILEEAIATLREFGVVCCTPSVVPFIRYELAEKLLTTFPSHLQRVALCTTGSEAVEAALKFMRAATGRPNVLTFFTNFHGFSYAGLAAGPFDAHWRDSVTQAIPGYLYAPYATCKRCPHRLTYPECNFWCVDAIEEVLLRHQAAPESIAGVIVEPIQGEAGAWVPPDGYLSHLERLCRKHDWLFCVDEVESGFGRCGRFWAFEASGVTPDLVIVGKGLSGSLLPIAAVVGTANVMDRKVAWGSTFAGQPASCAAAIKAIDRLQTSGLIERAARLGEIGLARLRRLQKSSPFVGDVRGLGLLLGVEMVRDQTTRERSSVLAQRVYDECLARGLCLLYLTVTPTVRVTPPLDLPEELFERGLGILEEVIHELKAEQRPSS
jgi:4-aminobutyrate aminotransferase-like enzyme